MHLRRGAGCVAEELRRPETSDERDQMTEDPHRKEQLRIQALGAAISIRNWHLAEKAYAAIRDAFDAKPLPGQAILDEVFPAPANKGVRMGVDNDNA
jgi:hypothetical protein